MLGLVGLLCACKFIWLGLRLDTAKYALGVDWSQVRGWTGVLLATMSCLIGFEWWGI